jgi:tetratricopeptide (TPR) repeat protein
MNWAQLAKGLVELRQGNLSDAVEACKASLVIEDARQSRWDRNVQAHLVIAMAYWRQEQSDDAREELTKAKTLVGFYRPRLDGDGGDTWGWLSCQPLFREAEEMILGGAPHDVDLGNQLAYRGQWSEAAQHFKKVFNAGTDGYSNNWHLQYAALLLETRDVEGYQQLCRHMLHHVRQSSSSADATLTAKVCLLDSLATQFVNEAAELAEKGDKFADAERNDFVASYAHLTNGLVELRRKNSESALKWCRSCLSKPLGGWTQEAQARLVIAMAHWQLGELDDARAAYDRASEILKENEPDFAGQGSDDWYNWLICQHLRREAEAMMVSSEKTSVD